MKPRRVMMDGFISFDEAASMEGRLPLGEILRSHPGGEPERHRAYGPTIGVSSGLHLPPEFARTEAARPLSHRGILSWIGAAAEEGNT